MNDNQIQSSSPFRFAMGVEYDGTHYHGWQGQPDTPNTIQAVVEKALSQVADEPIQVVCAGRTDAGVHAMGQVIHFDTSAKRDDHAWLFGVNSNLPNNICVHWVKQCRPDFHARFSATARRYLYVIYNHPTATALFRDRLTWCYRPLDHQLMQTAAEHLIGQHDFSSFRSSNCQSPSPVRCLTDLRVSRKDQLIIIDVSANAFLHHMVRNVAGVLMAIGVGKQPPQWAEQVLHAKDRRAASVTAAANGLYLLEVTYPDQFAIPKTSAYPVW